MKMKKMWQTLLASAGIAILAGCSSDHIPGGCYQPANPADGCIACVYEDIIFLRVKMPDNSNRPGANNDWAGKYELDKKSGEITLKMTDEQWRNWKFYFGLRLAGNTLKIDDFSRQTTYTLLSDTPAETSGNLQPMR